MRDIGLHMYRERMLRERPLATDREADALVWAWLAPGNEEIMTPTSTDAALRRAVSDLQSAGARWAIIGGWAVSARFAPRFTADVDFAVAVPGDPEAERLVYHLRPLGYAVSVNLEHGDSGRLSTVRMARSGSSVIVDLLFASSGIESEIVAGSTLVEVLPGLRAHVASTGHLIAMKALAGRSKDLQDLEGLISVASPSDISTARQAALLIQERGFSPEKDLPAELERMLAAAP